MFGCWLAEVSCVCLFIGLLNCYFIGLLFVVLVVCGLLHLL